MQGLPADPLSIQNGILVTRSSRFALMIDPQGQALSWIKNKEATNVPLFGQTTLTDTKLKDKLELCMADGLALIIVGVEEEIDPMLDPVLEKQLIVKGKRKFVNVSGITLYHTNHTLNTHYTHYTHTTHTLYRQANGLR